MGTQSVIFQGRLITQTLQRSRDQTAVTDKPVFIGSIIYRYDRRLPEKAAKVGGIASSFAGNRYQTGCGGLVVDDADRHFIGDNGGDTFSGCVAGDGDHIQTDGAHTGDGLQFFESDVTIAGRIGNIEIFTDRYEGAAQTPNP